jgi:hypothetical protein
MKRIVLGFWVDLLSMKTNIFNLFSTFVMNTLCAIGNTCNHLKSTILLEITTTISLDDKVVIQQLEHNISP